jgi:hypothetical protein
MVSWNNGMSEYWVWRNEIYFYLDDTDQDFISGHHPLFIPTIPFFHHSIVPLVIKQQILPLYG